MGQKVVFLANVTHFKPKNCKLNKYASVLTEELRGFRNVRKISPIYICMTKTEDKKLNSVIALNPTHTDDNVTLTSKVPPIKKRKIDKPRKVTRKSNLKISAD